MSLFADTSATDFAAWWGAIVASLVFLWDIYKWSRTGSRLAVSVKSNMFVDGPPNLAGQRLVFIEVVNVGNLPTSITKVYFYLYSNIWKWLFRKPEYFFIKNPGLPNSLPHKVEPGDSWTGFAFHTDEVESMMQNGYLYCAVFCSTRQTPVLARTHPST